MTTGTYVTTDCNTTNGYIWNQWCGTNAGTAGTYTTNNGVWTQWVTVGTAATTANTVAWDNWTCGTTNGATTQYATFKSNRAQYVPTPETKEQIAAREAKQKAFLEQQKKERDEREVAEKKAEELFREHLDPEQKKELSEKRHFHLISEKGKRFRIHIDSAHGNISELGDDGKVKRRLCAQPKNIPKFDMILAQKLALECCEDNLLRVANAS